MRVRIYEMDHGECPYLPDRQWVTHGFFAKEVPGAAYESSLADGWRRSGSSFYRNRCPGCNACTPIRIAAPEMRPTKSQRRVLRANSDVQTTLHAAEFDDETYQLYRRYVAFQHQHDNEDSPKQYRRFLVNSPVDTRIMRYYTDGRLIGAGWIDVLAEGISSVYFAFNPDAAKRSLGTYSVFQEASLATTMGMRWLYLGFYVADAQKMAYKARFAPHEFAQDGVWEPTPNTRSPQPGPG